jgi:hypothetical protein
MDDAVRPLADQFTVTGNFFIKALDGMDREALLTRPGARSNPPIWIAGHLTLHRARLLNLLGASHGFPWTGLFDTGSRITDLAVYPDASAIAELWRELSDDLNSRLDSMTATELASDAPPRIASPDGTMRGVISLFAFHEGYHIGQLGFLRKWLGFTPLLD